MQAELVLFRDENFAGPHTHVYGDVADLGKLNDWDNTVSSFRVVSGYWSFFADPQFKSQSGRDKVGPGLYPDVALAGVAPDAVSSVKLVRE